MIPQISNTLNTDAIFTYPRRLDCIPLIFNLKIICRLEMQTQYSEQERAV